jgi:signal peptidase I
LPPFDVRRLGRQAAEWVLVLAVAGAAAFVIRSFVVQRFFISGPSMLPTMHDGDQILVWKLAYRFGQPGRGDVVVFDRITTDGAIVQHDDLIKRVVATEGEVVEIRGCSVFVDGAAIEEPYLAGDPPDDPVERCRMPDMDPVTVPEGDIFVMGDNRSESFDSRMFGPVDSHQVVGRAIAVIWPFGEFTRL